MSCNLAKLIVLSIVLLGTAAPLQAQCRPVAVQATGETPPPPLDTAAGIMRIQQALVDVDRFAGEVNGKLDEETIKAITAYQKKNGMFADGGLSEVLLVHLLKRSKQVPDTPVAGEKPTDAGADDDSTAINRRDALGWTPLLHATMEASPNRVASLLKDGADVDMASHYGTTPLMVAVYMNRSKVLRVLLTHWPILGLADHNDEIAEELAFKQKRNRLLNRFRRHRVAMLGARLRRIPPFKVRMITWDKQECFVARKGRIEVICEIDPACRLERSTLVLCDKRGKKLLNKIASVVHKTWGGKPRVFDGQADDYAGPLICQQDDVMLLGIRP
jgi:peptidoglycan hydrolase-like protein with peptidoglycan-binding domain/ribosomal protein L36